MHVHAAVRGGLLQGHRGEVGSLGHQVAVTGGAEVEVALGQGLKAMLVACVAQVVRQQGVHHDPLQYQAVAHQDQAVVFGVLQGLGVGLTGKPWGQGPQHLIEGQLALRRGGIAEQIACKGFLVGDGDVGHLGGPRSPGQAHTHQLGAEGVQGGGLRVQGHGSHRIALLPQELQQGFQFLGALHQERSQFGDGIGGGPGTGPDHGPDIGMAGFAILWRASARSLVWGRGGGRP